MYDIPIVIFDFVDNSYTLDNIFSDKIKYNEIENSNTITFNNCEGVFKHNRGY